MTSRDRGITHRPRLIFERTTLVSIALYFSNVPSSSRDFPTSRARVSERKEVWRYLPQSGGGGSGRKSPFYSWQKVPGLAAAVCCAEDSRRAHACKHYLHTFGASVGGSRKRGISPVHRCLLACCVVCVCDPLRMFLSLAKSRTRLGVSQAMPAPAGSQFRS